MDSKILIIFELVPEETYLFLLDATDDNLSLAKEVNRKFINSDELTEEQVEFILGTTVLRPLTSGTEIKDINICFICVTGQIA